MIFDADQGLSASAGGADAVSDGNTQNFASDVIEQSMTVPVIVDFWAPWCGPCKQLTPILERLVRAARGRVRLVKINIDENQGLAAQLRVQSVPMVYAFVQGRPVDVFTGAQPESQVKAFVNRLVQMTSSPLEAHLEQAQSLLDEGDARAAAHIFGQIRMQDPENEKAIAGLIRAHVALGDLRAARTVAGDLSPEALKSTIVTQALSAVSLAEEAQPSTDIKTLRKRLEAEPEDHQARFELANAHYARGQTEAAIDGLLHIVKKDRTWNDDAARKQLVKIFDALGPTHPLTAASRRRLSSILFS